MKTVVMLVLVLMLVAGIAVNGSRAQPLLNGLCDRSLGLRPPTCRSPRLPYVFDGETLFKGLFFGQGPVAALFPEITERLKSIKPTPEADLFVTQVIARLRQHDRSYFDRLAAGLQSGDHLAIEATMDHASRVFLKALQEEVGAIHPIIIAQIEGGLEIASSSAISSATQEGGTVRDGAGALDDGDGTFFFYERVVFITQHLAINQHAATNVVVVVNQAVAYQTEVVWGGGDSAASDLQRELWVNLLAQRLPQARVDESSLFPVARTAQRPRITIAQVEGGTEIVPPGPPDQPGTNLAGDIFLDQDGMVTSIYRPSPFLDHNLTQLLPVVLPFPPVLSW